MICLDSSPNPRRRGDAVAAFAGAVSPESKTTDAATTTRRGGRRGAKPFNFKSWAKAERMQAMRQAARRP